MRRNIGVGILLWFIVTVTCLLASSTGAYLPVYMGIVLAGYMALDVTRRILAKTFRVPVSHSVTCIPYFSFNLIAIINALACYASYGNFFGAYVDDSKYFYRAVDIANGVFIGPTSLYEPILARGIRLLGVVSGDTSRYVVYLLPLNALCMSVAIGVASQVYFQFRNEPMPLKYLVLACLNINVLSSTVYLYREPLVIMTFFVALIAILKGQRVVGAIFLILTFSLRGAFGILLLALVVLVRLSEGRRFDKKVVLVGGLVALLVVAIFFDMVVPYVSFFGNNTLQAYAGSVLRARVEQRTERLGGIKGSVFSYAFLRPFVFILSPVTLAAFSSVIDVKQNIGTWETITFEAEVVNLLSPISWFTTCLLLYAVPVILLGVRALYVRGGKSEQVLSLFFVFCWIAICVFSMQVRHLAVLFLLYPVMYEYGKDGRNHRNGSFFLWSMRSLFIALVLVVNLVSWLG